MLDDDLVIRDTSSRNHVHRVETRTGPSYLVKQRVGDDAMWTVANEASVYHHLGGAAGGMSAYLPGFFGYDGAERVLVLELLRDAQDLRSLHLHTGAFPPHAGSLLGRALGTLHRETAVGDSAPAPESATWVLWIDRPDARVFRDVSAAGLDLIRIIQATDGFPEALAALRSRWVTTSLIHGDLKWDNCLMCRADSEAPQLRLVDWEGAVAGDPCWDIGSALSQYLGFWIFSMPVTGQEPPERFPDLAQYPLASMKPAMAACWSAYVEARGLDDLAAAEELDRAVGYAAARLVQTAFEALQMMQQLTSATVLHLQLALNILLRPRDAAAQLMGISPIRAMATV